jgi:hypothetical protein
VKRIGLYPRVQVDTGGAGVVSQAGGVALVETARAAGLDRALSTEFARWRRPAARHDPGKMIIDRALTIASVVTVISKAVAAPSGMGRPVFISADRSAHGSLL